MNQDLIESEMIKTATRNLQKSGRILYPEQASVQFPEFDPCRAVQPIAVVQMPAIINCKEVILSHSICDGDSIY